jgi:hypothetical protein
MKRHECMSPLCNHLAELVGVRDNLEVFRCREGHEFACNPRLCLSHNDVDKKAYMMKRNQALQEGWCVRDGFRSCDCVLCKQLH